MGLLKWSKQLKEKSKSFKKRFIRRASSFSKPQLLIFALIFVCIGIYILIKSLASTPMPSASLSAMALNSGQQNYLGDTSRYKYVILSNGMYASVPAIKAANPNTKVLVYKNAAFAGNDCQYTSRRSSMSYCYVQANHPDWFLTQNGQPFATCDFSWLYWMDIGNANYQAQWASSMAADAKADGFDGVFIDDVNTHPGHCMDGLLQKYTDDQYGQAMNSFIASVGASLKSQGLLSVGNVSADPWSSSQESIALQMTPNLTALFREHFMHWNATSVGLFSDAIWTSVMQQLDDVGKVGNYLANTYSSATDTQAMRYGRASFLLGWNGNSASAFQYHVDAQVDSYNAEWTADVGTPLAARYQVGTAWRRDFTAGTVVVNPSSTQTATVSLGGNYINSSGATVSSVTLGPTSAQILKSTTIITDTMSPTLSLTSPTNGSTVSGTVPVSASATDNVGVVGVQFKLDGANLDAEDTTSPYSTGWNTTTSSIGPHTITAVARDAAGNTTVSSSVSVTVSNITTTPPPPPPTSGTVVEKAQGKPTTTSSTESTSLAPSNANDGSSTTRWGSSYADNQWWSVDLGSSTPVERVDINWETAYASHYLIQGSNDNSTWAALADVTNSASGLKSTYFNSTSVRYVRMYGLTRGTTYGFSMWEMGVYGSGNTTISPTIPTGLRVSSVGNSTVSLDWDDETGNFGHYQVYRNDALIADGPSVSNYTDTGLANGTIYTYRVSAGASPTYSGWTNPVSATPVASDTTPPTTPSGPTASASAYNKVNLSWSASSDNVGIAGYYIVRGGTTIAKTVGTGTTYSDTSVSPSTNYSYQVIAYDAANNNSALSTAANVTTPSAPDTTAPTTPTNLNASAASSSQINLSWSASTDNIGVTGYDVYRNNAKIATSTTTSFGDTGLTVSTSYSYYIIAKDAAGNSSSASAGASATTKAGIINTGSLTGRIYRSNGFQGLSATVSLAVNGSQAYYTSDSSGGYFISNLPYGTYSVTYSASGYVSKTLSTSINSYSTKQNVTLTKF
jgi:chitodextrinase